MWSISLKHVVKVVSPFTLRQPPLLHRPYNYFYPFRPSSSFIRHLFTPEYALKLSVCVEELGVVAFEQPCLTKRLF